MTNNLTMIYLKPIYRSYSMSILVNKNLYLIGLMTRFLEKVEVRQIKMKK